MNKLYPKDRSPDGVLALLATLYRASKQEAKELAILNELATINDRALDAYAKLAKSSLEKQKWNEAKQFALRFLSVQPMLPTGHELLAEASTKLNEPKHVAAALTALLEMEPVDPAQTHFRLAKALGESDDLQSAKRQVLMALEEAPRFRDAQKYLLELREQAGNGQPTKDSVITEAK